MMAKASPHGRRYSPEDRAAAVALSEQIGASKAARRFGVSLDSLRKWRTDAGYPLLQVGRKSQTSWEDRAAAVEMAASIGLTAAAREYNVAQNTVLRWRDALANREENAAQKIMSDSAESPKSAPLTVIEAAIVAAWPGRCLRVVADAGTAPAGHYLILHGQQLPVTAAPSPRFALHGIGTLHAAYMDGELCAKAGRLPLHPATLAPLVDRLGGAVAAQDALTALVFDMTGFALVAGSQRMADRARLALSDLGFFARAKSEKQRTAIAALCARDIVQKVVKVDQE